MKEKLNRTHGTHTDGCFTYYARNPIPEDKPKHILTNDEIDRLHVAMQWLSDLTRGTIK